MSTAISSVAALESKVALTDRLRAEGRWGEASVFKDQEIKRLRAEGMKKSEAFDVAWGLLAERYPPLPPVEPGPEPVADELDEEYELDEEEAQAMEAAAHKVREWEKKHGTALSRAARESLVEEVAVLWVCQDAIPGGLLDEPDNPDDGEE